MDRLDEATWAAVVAHPDTELNPPSDAAALAAFEAWAGFALPASHREFLRRANGGVAGLARLFGVGRGDLLDLDLDAYAATFRPELERTAGGPVFPFANDWGGSLFCYDLRRPGPPPILLWNHEYSEEPDDLPMLWSAYAPDFPAFLRGIIA